MIIGREKIEKNIPAVKFNKIKIVENGEERELSQKETKKYIADLLFGGKSLDTLERNLIEAGVKGNAWATRKKIIKLLEDWFSDTLDKEGKEALITEFELNQEEEE